MRVMHLLVLALLLLSIIGVMLAESPPTPPGINHSKVSTPVSVSEEETSVVKPIKEPTYNATKPSILWRYSGVILHGFGFALTNNLDDFYIIKAHLRSLYVASQSICAASGHESDDECLDVASERVVIGALKLDEKLYKVKGVVSSGEEDNGYIVEAALYDKETPYKCLLSVSNVSVCVNKPQPSGKLYLKVHRNNKGKAHFGTIAVGKLSIDNREYLVGIRGFVFKKTLPTKKMHKIEVAKHEIIKHENKEKSEESKSSTNVEYKNNETVEGISNKDHKEEKEVHEE